MFLAHRTHLAAFVRLCDNCTLRTCVFFYQSRNYTGKFRSEFSYRKEPRRKPRWLPTAPSKLFRIPQHPYVPPDEQELIDELNEEYNRHVDSIREMFKLELIEKSKEVGSKLQKQKEEEERFLQLLEENKKENERMRLIREEAMEKMFQEKVFKYMQLAEVKKQEEEFCRHKVNEIVRAEKDKIASSITPETLDRMIENALDNPINRDFAVDVHGNIKWETDPPKQFEDELKERIRKSLEN